jgi:acetyl-CoA/propionyl-CoA carboxylase biotin carboxyl carrier protein
VEAMKMEHVLTAPLDGVATPLVAVGDSVALGQVVGRVEPVTGSPGPGIPGAGTAGAD